MTTDKTAADIMDMADTSIGELGVAGHQPGYTQLLVQVIDGEIVDAMVLVTIDAYYRSVDGTWYCVYTAGTGSCPCNCDACQHGDDPADWAGDGEHCEGIEDDIDRGIAELQL